MRDREPERGERERSRKRSGEGERAREILSFLSFFGFSHIYPQIFYISKFTLQITIFPQLPPQNKFVLDLSLIHI